MFQIYNKSSEEMKEIADALIDLVICDPPWNVGLAYEQRLDSAPLEDYKKKMSKILKEIKRVLKEDGTVILVLPKIVKKDGKIINYPEIFKEISKNLGFSKNTYFDFKVKEDDFTCEPEEKIPFINADCHSEEIQLLVFKNKKIKNIFPKNKRYVYKSKEGHPCPYPQDLIKDILDTFYVESNKVLDPFMGTGGLGKEVLKRNGEFFGYELEKKYFETAKEKLSGVRA